MFAGFPKQLRRAVLVLAPLMAHAEPHWIRARLGPFEAISDDGRRSAIQSLSQFAQFSHALGAVIGQPELKLEPPLRIIVFKTEKDLQLHCPSESAAALRDGRDRLMACAVEEGQLPQPLLRELTRKLLEANFPGVPAGIEAGLESFFSTIQSSAVHVTWGAPPPAAERTRDWALLHRIVTQPEYTAKARIYLHNLASGMDRPAAARNAFGEDAAKFEKDVDDYYAAGIFTTATAPSRPLNPDRDFNTAVLTSDEGELMRADLLTPDSAAAYDALLKAGKHATECNEGLGILALRSHDDARARQYFKAARTAGTKNFVALTEYARIEPDPDKALEILRDALTINEKYALAHWIYGEKLSDPARRLNEWKQAVALAPRNYEWLARYAQLALDQKQYAEAGRAWMAASLAAPDAARRERFLSARANIEQQRLDAEDAERRRAADDKRREIESLKTQARKELADLEARVNTHPLSAAEAARTVDWYDSAAEGKLVGMLQRVECSGKTAKLVVKDEEGKTQTILVSDSTQLLIQGGGKETTLTCGPQRQRKITVGYKRSEAKGVLGEATGLEFD